MINVHPLQCLFCNNPNTSDHVSSWCTYALVRVLDLEYDFKICIETYKEGIFRSSNVCLFQSTLVHNIRHR